MPQRGRAVHVASENGKLIGVTAVARVHPRNWDGRRLLRFLTGLAMLALAFTAPAVQAPAAMPATVAVSEAAPAPVTSVTLGEPAPAPLPVRAPVAPGPAEILTLLIAGLTAVALVGRTPRLRGERAPPATA